MSILSSSLGTVAHWLLVSSGWSLAVDLCTLADLAATDICSDVSPEISLKVLKNPAWALVGWS